MLGNVSIIEQKELYIMYAYAVAHSGGKVVHGQHQKGYMSWINSILVETTVLESHMREAYAFDGAHFANTSFERLNSLGALMGGVGERREYDGNQFTSKMINKGVELELTALQAMAEEIQRATTNQRKLTQLQLDHLKSTQYFVDETEEGYEGASRRIRNQVPNNSGGRRAIQTEISHIFTADRREGFRSSKVCLCRNSI